MGLFSFWELIILSLKMVGENRILAQLLGEDFSTDHLSFKYFEPLLSQSVSDSFMCLLAD